jgi:hypothetical protein
VTDKYKHVKLERHKFCKNKMETTIDLPHFIDQVMFILQKMPIKLINESIKYVLTAEVNDQNYLLRKSSTLNFNFIWLITLDWLQRFLRTCEYF